MSYYHYHYHDYITYRCPECGKIVGPNGCHEHMGAVEALGDAGAFIGLAVGWVLIAPLAWVAGFGFPFIWTGWLVIAGLLALCAIVGLVAAIAGAAEKKHKQEQSVNNIDTIAAAMKAGKPADVVMKELDNA